MEYCIRLSFYGSFYKTASLMQYPEMCFYQSFYALRWSRTWASINITSQGQNTKMMPFIQAAGKSRHGNWCRAADTHVLVWADQEPMMNVSLHQAGLPNTLLSQHHHFGIHTHGAHSIREWRRSRGKGQPHSKQQGAVNLQGSELWKENRRQNKLVTILVKPYTQITFIIKYRIMFVDVFTSIPFT